MANEEKLDLISLARKQFQSARTGWEKPRAEFTSDIKFVTGDQWDPKDREARERAFRPALTENRLHIVVQDIQNQARQNRPEIKIKPSDNVGSDATAEVLEGYIRQIQYISQADIAYDTAVDGTSSGGFAFYRINVEYTGPNSFDQEPRIERILDPLTVYFDPNAIKPDLSDARYCFVRKKMALVDYKSEFGKDPTPFEGDDDGCSPDWADDDGVWVAEYWRVEEDKDDLLALSDGSTVLRSQGVPKGLKILKSRPQNKRRVVFDLIDGGGSLQHTEWLGQWIPIIPVLGKEMVVQGKRMFISAIRFAKDPQRLLNAAKSGIAESMGLANRVPYTGPKGTFKSPMWENANSQNYPYLEYDPVYDQNGNALPAPKRDSFEPAIQALTQFSVLEADALKATTGYVDSLIRPSQADLSGIAVKRRQQGADLANFHIVDNLSRSQWFAGRVLLDLISKLVDVPREIRIRAMDGTLSTAMVGVQGQDGQPQLVQGKEDQKHHFLDVDSYHVIIATGPGYDAKRDEAADVLLQVLGRDPAAWAGFLDLFFKMINMPELEHRAKMLLPPAIQQAQTLPKDIPPQIAAQLASLAQQNQQLKAGLQQALQVIKMKQVEAQSKLEVERLKTAGNVVVESMKQSHSNAQMLFDKETEAIQHITEMLHESELAPDPNAPPEGGSVQ